MSRDEDQPDPEDVAAFEWVRIAAKTRQSIELRLDRGDADKMTPEQLAIFLDCQERAYAGDMAAHSFAANLRRSRDDDQFSGAYTDE